MNSIIVLLVVGVIALLAFAGVRAVWRDGDWNGLVRIAIAGRLDFARGLLRQIRKYAIIPLFPKKQRSLLVG